MTERRERGDVWKSCKQRGCGNMSCAALNSPWCFPCTVSAASDLGVASDVVETVLHLVIDSRMSQKEREEAKAEMS